MSEPEKEEAFIKDPFLHIESKILPMNFYLGHTAAEGKGKR